MPSGFSGQIESQLLPSLNGFDGDGYSAEGVVIHSRYSIAYSVNAQYNNTMISSLPVLPFGAFVRARRQSLGIALNDFAARIGISPAYWSRIERDMERPPKDALIDACAQVLGIDADEIYTQAGRLPPDLRPHLKEIVQMWRKRRARQ